MITYPASWLAPRTRLATPEDVASHFGWVRVRAFDIIKGVIRTPMSNGKVDWDAVPVGQSVWITVTDESSPLHGRPILVTKRPDGQFALEGGSGASHWMDDERGKKMAARKHLVLNIGKPRPQNANEELARKIGERDEKRAALAEKGRQARQAKQEAAKATRAAIGLPEEARLSHRERQVHQANLVESFKRAGAQDSDAERYARAMVRELSETRQRFMARQAILRLQKAREKIGGDLLLDESQGDLLGGSLEQNQQAQQPSSPDDPLAALRLDPEEPNLAEPAKLQIDATEMVQAMMQAEQENGKPLSEAQAEVAAQTEADRQFQEQIAPPEEELPPEAAPDAAPTEEEATEPDDGGLAALHAVGDETSATPDSDDYAGLADFGQDVAATRQADEMDLGQPEHEDPHQIITLADLPAWEEQDPENARAALDAFRREMDLRGAAADLRQDLKQYEGLQMITPSAVDRQSIRASGIDSDEEFEKLCAQYANIHKLAPVGAFYAALGQHWNDAISYADGVGGYAEQGAVGAVTGLLGETGLLDHRIDVSKLIGSLGIEGAAYALATDLIYQNRHQPKVIGKLINGLTEYNAANQQQTEDRAMRRHRELQATQATIEQMLQSGELAGGLTSDIGGLPSSQIRSYAAKANAEGIRLLAENLASQRSNLGTALGSMQMAATMLHALESTAKLASSPNQGDRAGAKFVSLYYGDNKVFRDEVMRKISPRHGALVPEHHIHLGYGMRVDTSRLGKYISRVKTDGARNRDWEATKNSDEGVKEIDGQEVVPGYKVPFFKDSFIDADGEEKPIHMRKNQRNDIEWLRKSGGGVITRTTGAGKTNTTLGFFAHKIAENPKYHGVAVVPNRRGGQWQSEAQNFTNLHTVTVPDNASNETAEQLIRNFNSADNGVLIVGHKQAARQAHWLRALHESGRLHGMAIDEPQEMMGQAKDATLTAGAKEVMKVGSKKEVSPGGAVRYHHDPDFNRIALTATPAKRAPVQAFDLANWVAPGQLGPRARFNAAFKGFGEGTSAADDALANTIGREVGPYVSGDQEVKHPFPLHVKEHLVLRTPQQRDRQREIEQTAQPEIDRLAKQRFDELRSTKAGAARTPQDVRYEAGQWARQAIARRHVDNLDSGVTNDDGNLLDPQAAVAGNAKLRAFVSEVKAASPGHKHVVFVDGKAQKDAVTAALRGAGYGPGAIKHITDNPSLADTESRKRSWKLGGSNVPFLLIDKASASGHNLQEGDHLHVLGAPDDAATLLQAQGRVARGNKRTATTIHTYKTHDSPFETKRWEDIDRGMKLMAATSPGLARGFLKRVTKARDAAIGDLERHPEEPPGVSAEDERLVAKSRAAGLYLLAS